MLCTGKQKIDRIRLRCGIEHEIQHERLGRYIHTGGDRPVLNLEDCLGRCPSERHGPTPPIFLLGAFPTGGNTVLCVSADLSPFSQITHKH